MIAQTTMTMVESASSTNPPRFSMNCFSKGPPSPVHITSADERTELNQAGVPSVASLMSDCG